ncbi:hypothetical protein Q9966_007710 [Columba livia]|nr:hypothetical protein Q9966_007710 [Columba livia]
MSCRDHHCKLSSATYVSTMEVMLSSSRMSPPPLFESAVRDRPFQKMPASAWHPPTGQSVAELAPGTASSPPNSVSSGAYCSRLDVVLAHTDRRKCFRSADHCVSPSDETSRCSSPPRDSRGHGYGGSGTQSTSSACKKYSKREKIAHHISPEKNDPLKLAVSLPSDVHHCKAPPSWTSRLDIDLSAIPAVSTLHSKNLHASLEPCDSGCSQCNVQMPDLHASMKLYISTCSLMIKPFQADSPERSHAYSSLLMPQLEKVPETPADLPTGSQKTKQGFPSGGSPALQITRFHVTSSKYPGLAQQTVSRDIWLSPAVLTRRENPGTGNEVASKDLNPELVVFQNHPSSRPEFRKTPCDGVTPAHHKVSKITLILATPWTAMPIQVIYLKSSDLGSSVDEVEQLIRKHEAFEKVMASQDEKMMSLQEQASRLEKFGGLEGLKIQQKLNAIQERKQQIKNLSQSRREKLQTALLLALFYQNLEEAEDWISERTQKLEDPSIQDLSNLQDKMKLLQKHQVFEAEILANEEIITAVNKKGEALLSRGHPKSGEIRHRVRMLQERWEKLKRAVAARGKMLEDSRDFLEFLQKVDQVEAWIREKEVMINVGDVGNDYEHCLQLMKKLNEFRGATSGETTVDDAHIRAINALAMKLERQNKEETKTIYERRKQLNEKWNSFHGNLNAYRKKLEGALEIHALIREIDDITERITEKSVLIQALDYGKDVESVENLIRRHEEMEREISVIKSKMEPLELESFRLSTRNPSINEKLTMKQQEMKNNWLRLQGQAKQRKEKLAASYQLQKFNLEMKEMLDWTQNIRGLMETGGLPKRANEAESMIEEHQERKASIIIASD